MHPPLHVSKHPHCKDAIEALVSCHAAHPLAKFAGACNAPKAALDRCLREEKALNRRRNAARAAAERDRLRARLREQGLAAADGAAPPGYPAGGPPPA